MIEQLDQHRSWKVERVSSTTSRHDIDRGNLPREVTQRQIRLGRCYRCRIGRGPWFYALSAADAVDTALSAADTEPADDENGNVASALRKRAMIERRAAAPGEPRKHYSASDVAEIVECMELSPPPKALTPALVAALNMVSASGPERVSRVYDQLRAWAEAYGAAERVRKSRRTRLGRKIRPNPIECLNNLFSGIIGRTVDLTANIPQPERRRHGRTR